VLPAACSWRPYDDFTYTRAKPITSRARCSDDWTMVSPDAMVFIARKVDGSSPQPPVSGVRIAGCGEPVRRRHAGWATAGMPEPQQHIVFIVDDDRRIRDALSMLLLSFDMRAVTFGSAAEYMAYPKPDVPTCLVLDVQLPDINGLDLQSQIAQANSPHIVFISGHGDIPSTVRAIKAGAVDFLTKPFREEHLMRAINAALAQNREARCKRTELDELAQRLSRLTPREREVLPLVASGLLNKQAAAELRISEVTLQIHRSSVMKKMGAASLAELVRMAGSLAIPLTGSRRTRR